MTPREWKSFMGLARARWPEHSGLRGPEWAEAWWPAFRNVPLEVAVRALERFSARSRGFPPDGGQLLQEVSAEALAVGLPSWPDCWRDVRDAIGRFGAARPPVFRHRITARVVASVGWREICMTQESDAGTLRAQVRGMYEQFREQVSGALFGLGSGEALELLDAAPEWLALPEPARVIEASVEGKSERLKLPDLSMDRLKGE